MAKARDYEMLARLKLKKLELEEKIEEKKKQILSNNPTEKAETPHGTLSLTKRENFTIPDNFNLINSGLLEEEDFIKNAKIAPSTLKKIIGEKQFDGAIELNVVNRNEPTFYYCLRRNKA